MYTMIFDTETTDLNKCFCYNIGYVILDTDTNETAEVTGAAAESAAETEPDAADAAEPDPASTEKEESGDE